VVARAVGSRFETMALVVPSETFFPEPFEPTLGWYKRVTSRFMGLCGLGGYELVVDLFDAGTLQRLDEHPRIGRLEGHTEAHRTVAWFAGLDVPATGRPRCHFGLDLRQLREPETLVASMAHEVAHAFRAHHGLTELAAASGARLGIADLHRYEEELTDLTTHALGFGVLTTNSAYRYRQTGGYEGTSAWVAWSHGSAGYLSHNDMSYLLAVTLLYRAKLGGATTSKEAGGIVKWLERNQAAMVKSTVRERADLEPFEARMAAVAARKTTKGVTGVAEVFAPSPYAPHVLDEVDLQRDLLEESRRNHLSRHTGMPVFRVPKDVAMDFRPFSDGRKSYLVARLVGIGGAIGAVAAATVWLGNPSMGLFLGLAIGAVGDAAIRQAFSKTRDFCSEPDCESVQPEDTVVCPGCSGTIAGTIANADERLAARDKLGLR
jgi:hypothetical protein